MVAVFSLHQPREPGETFRAAIRCANDADGRPHNQQGRVRGLLNQSDKRRRFPFPEATVSVACKVKNYVFVGLIEVAHQNEADRIKFAATGRGTDNRVGGSPGQDSCCRRDCPAGACRLD